MKAEYINPFVVASFSVLEMVLGNKPIKGRPRHAARDLHQPAV